MAPEPLPYHAIRPNFPEDFLAEARRPSWPRATARAHLRQRACFGAVVCTSSPSCPMARAECPNSTLHPNLRAPVASALGPAGRFHLGRTIPGRAGRKPHLFSPLWNGRFVDPRSPVMSSARTGNPLSRQSTTDLAKADGPRS